jgi:drug/metabolite transporter (DMT)-like permease
VAGVTAALEPVYGVALAAALLGEPLPARTLAGGLCIVGAAVWMAARTARPAPSGFRP